MLQSFSHKQWKQLLCYYFCSGPMKFVVLGKEIEEVAEECLNSDFKVIATVCDQYCAPAVDNASVSYTNH